jgi:hypothetical protein
MAIMAVWGGVATVSFSRIAGYLFSHGLADPRALHPDIRSVYQTYITHRRKVDGRIGVVFWIHSVSAGLFICTGVVYTVIRFVIPLVR